jgi:hypothetical protein
MVVDVVDVVDDALVPFAGLRGGKWMGPVIQGLCRSTLVYIGC